MSAKPAAKKPRSYHYSFQLPDGNYVGRNTFHAPLQAVIPHRAIWYTVEGIRARRGEILALFPAAKIVATPKWNEEAEEWETPSHVPPLN
jgi:hypothetical protein